MSTETVVETVIVTEIVAEAGGFESVVEREIVTELVTENVGATGSPGKSADEIAMPDLSLIFEGALL